MQYDPTLLVNAHREDLLREAEVGRLAAQAMNGRASLRRGLAQTCHRLADWLDGPMQYAPPSDSGRSDWAGRSVCA